MKQVVLILGILAIAANLLFGYIITAYLWRAALMSSLALGAGVAMLMLVSSVNMKDAFRISLNVLFPLLTLIQFITLLFVPQEGFNSLCYVIAIIIFLLQCVLLVAANSVSKIN
ncbi:hypothetical protein [Sodaliphilus sp.]|uniref:hypothetical protein n=1 Tax=Sodaliphilus sp. TaxID=2815818 RepID=UPI00388F72F9